MGVNLPPAKLRALNRTFEVPPPLQQGSNLLAKLEMGNRSEAAAYAARLGAGQAEDAGEDG